MDKDDLIARYEAAVADEANDMHEHLPTMFGGAVDTNAKTVIELGVRGGISTLAWLLAMELTGGTVWGVDIDDAPELFATSPHWTFIKGDDLDARVYWELPSACDILFIDTSHEYRHTLAELFMYGRLVRPGGIIFLHDTELEDPFVDYPELHAVHTERYPVREAITQYCSVMGYSWTNTPRCYGLGRILVP